MLSFYKYFRLSSSERKIFYLCVSNLFKAWYKTRFQAPKKYLKKVGLEGTIAKNPISEDFEYIFSVKRGIARAVKVTPFKTKCLQQAIAGKIILNKNSIPCTIYFGLSKKENKLKAHAWLKAGEVFVTGQKGHKDFTVVSTFG
ncbi:MAG: lasso peptide biosynthesis B2 protein [Bacteroidales bacterium]|nr:lasso peptide biosynthesis B2 protein [Bacteroidales bacterium]